MSILSSTWIIYEYFFSSQSGNRVPFYRVLPLRIVEVYTSILFHSLVTSEAPGGGWLVRRGYMLYTIALSVVWKRYQGGNLVHECLMFFQHLAYFKAAVCWSDSFLNICSLTLLLCMFVFVTDNSYFKILWFNSGSIGRLQSRLPLFLIILSLRLSVLNYCFHISLTLISLWEFTR